MFKKALFYICAFIFLMLINGLVTYKYFRIIHRQSQIQSLLSEIDHAKSDKQQQFRFSAVPYVPSYQTDITVTDGRTANLKIFFRKYNSALYDYADVIVANADKYQFDYRLLPAIAMQESNLCKYIPENSFNCWGWGIYGDLTTRFQSYPEAIETVSKGIKDHYIDNGLVTASAIMAKYTPSSNGSWANAVNIFLRALE